MKRKGKPGAASLRPCQWTALLPGGIGSAMDVANLVAYLWHSLCESLNRASGFGMSYVTFCRL